MNAKQKWNELSKPQKTRIIVLSAVQVALQSAALKDLVNRPAHLVRGPKTAWVGATFVNFAGPIAYFLVGRRTA
jgi:hypothetical protein